MAAEKDQEVLIKVVLAGDFDVGKTCLLNQFTERSFSNLYSSTIGSYTSVLCGCTCSFTAVETNCTNTVHADVCTNPRGLVDETRWSKMMFTNGPKPVSLICLYTAETNISRQLYKWFIVCHNLEEYM